MRSHAVSTDDIRSRLPMSSPLLARFGRGLCRPARAAGYDTTRYPRRLRGCLAGSACAVRHQTPGGNVSDLKAKFDKAVADSKNLPERPDNQTLLKLYALFKQASTGDVEGKRP